MKKKKKKAKKTESGRHNYNGQAITKKDLKEAFSSIKSDIKDMKIDIAEIKKDNREFKHRFKKQDVDIQVLKDAVRVQQ